MNFGKSVKKLASELNVVLSLCNSTAIYKTNYVKALEFKCNNVKTPISTPVYKLNSANLYVPLEEKFNSIIKNDNPVQKKIEEPGKIVKIKIKLPIGNLEKILDFPCLTENEIKEPTTKIISKKADSAFRKSIKDIKGKHIISIRKRKMRIHKRKKYMRKHKVELMKKKADRTLKKEFDFQMQLKEVIKTSESFSPEEYLRNTLKTVNWKRPVTKVRGILAPKWVIKEHLAKQEEDKILQQRLEECISSRK